MTFIKVNDELYPVIEINGYMIDHNWNERASKYITLNMSVEQAKTVFTDDCDWSIVVKTVDNIYDHDPITGESIFIEAKENITEYGNSDYSVAGDIIDHRDGTITVKMGTVTRDELLTMLMEGLDL